MAKNKQPIEKEIKILEIEPKKLVKSISEIGGCKILDDTTRMSWFDMVEVSHDNSKRVCYCKDVRVCEVVDIALKMRKKLKSSFRDKDVYFRIRQQGDTCDLTIKRNKKVSNNVLVNDEYSYDFPIKNLKEVTRCVTSAGFTCIAQHEKKRISYSYTIPKGSEVRIDIDEWPGIPPYVEIEGRRKKDILNMVDILGLRGKVTSTKIGRAFFESYGVEFFSNLTFDSGKSRR